MNLLFFGVEMKALETVHFEAWPRLGLLSFKWGSIREVSQESVSS